METLKSLSTTTQAAGLARPIRGAVAVACLAMSAALAGCSSQKAASAAQTQGPNDAATPASGDIPNVLATIGDEEITMADVRARIGDNLDQMEARYRQTQYKLVNNTLQEILRERVLLDEAKRQGKTADQLVAAEIGGSMEPSDVEIAAWYQENPSRTGGRALEQIKPQIADYLRNERRKQAVSKLEARLNEERKVTVRLEPYRLPLNNEGAPSMGPANAPVTLVEFSDFDCPYCGRFHPTLKKLTEKFGDQLRVVYRQYPIVNLHPNAFKAAEASLCANEQGKFWEMHDLMFQEQGRLSVGELKVKAGRIGLDQKKFDECLNTGRFTEQVQEDQKEGGRAGVTGTPALFVNGVIVEGGAVSLDVVAQAIEKELARTKR